MPLTFLVGGARSGKSGLAVRLASEWEGPVVVLATAEARDDSELAARIARHRLERPASWRTDRASSCRMHPARFRWTSGE